MSNKQMYAFFTPLAIFKSNNIRTKTKQSADCREELVYVGFLSVLFY